MMMMTMIMMTLMTTFTFTSMITAAMSGWAALHAAQYDTAANIRQITSIINNHQSTTTINNQQRIINNQ